MLKVDSDYKNNIKHYKQTKPNVFVRKEAAMFPAMQLKYIPPTFFFFPFGWLLNWEHEEGRSFAFTTSDTQSPPHLKAVEKIFASNSFGGLIDISCLSPGVYGIVSCVWNVMFKGPISSFSSPLVSVKWLRPPHPRLFFPAVPGIWLKEMGVEIVIAPYGCSSSEANKECLQLNYSAVIYVYL